MEVQIMSDTADATLSNDEGIHHPHGNTVTVGEMLDYFQRLVAANPACLTRGIHVASGVGMHDVYQVEWSPLFGVVLSMM